MYVICLEVTISTYFIYMDLHLEWCVLRKNFLKWIDFEQVWSVNYP